MGKQKQIKKRINLVKVAWAWTLFCIFMEFILVRKIILSLIIIFILLTMAIDWNRRDKKINHNHQ